MIIDVLTIFPSFFLSPFKESILGKSIERNLVRIRIYNIRDFTNDKHHMVDDRPYGGGAGMVMKPEPIVNAIEELQGESPKGTVILLSPQGEIFTQAMARELSSLQRLILVCGRYEGVDARVGYFVDKQVSIGDYVLSGGEPAALIVIDAIVRLIPSVVGNMSSIESESFERGLLEHPHYTRPRNFCGLEVPEVLLSGNHEAIRKWRLKQSLILTKQRRPDLFSRLDLSDEEIQLIHDDIQSGSSDTRGNS